MKTWNVSYIDDTNKLEEVVVVFRTFNPRNNTWQLRTDDEEEIIVKKNKIVSMVVNKEKE
jgi:hypothetical protein